MNPDTATVAVASHGRAHERERPLEGPAAGRSSAARSSGVGQQPGGHRRGDQHRPEQLGQGEAAGHRATPNSHGRAARESTQAALVQASLAQRPDASTTLTAIEHSITVAKTAM